nr:glycosyl hydrolase family 85 [Tanacetum cinerariifolium]
MEVNLDIARIPILKHFVSHLTKIYEHKRTCYYGNGVNEGHDGSGDNCGNGTGCGKLNEHINALDMLDVK